MSVVKEWSGVGHVDAARLEQARLAAHWALQPVAAFAQSVVPPQPGDVHQALTWDRAGGAFVSQPSRGGARAALRLRDSTLLLHPPDEGPAAELSLEGVSVERGTSWLGERLAEKEPRHAPLERPGYELPAHPTGEGEPFAPFEAEALDELATWYDASASELAHVVSSRHGASPVRCWPHHFDVATLITLDGEEDPERARSVGVGMTPGDGSYAEPYLYVTPWPYPESPRLDDLPAGGQWHREGWLGGVLPAGALLACEADGRPGAVRSFVDAALAASFGLLDA